MNSLYISSLFLLKRNHICIQEEEFKLELLSHPDHNTLLGLTDTLSTFNIKYIVGECNYNDLINNNQPVLVLFESDFIVIQEVNEKKVVYYDSEKKSTAEIERDIFEKGWNGSVLYITDEKSFNPNCFLTNLFQKHKEWILVSGLILLSASIFHWNNIENLSYCIIKIVGIVFCTLLTNHHLKINNSLVSNICKNGKTFSCDTVLNSKYSHILGISLSDIGMVYFGTTLVALFYSNITNDNRVQFLLSCISLCTLPVICISVCYQGLIIKKWCPLCMGAITTLLAEVLLSIYYIFYVKIPFVLNFRTPIILLGFMLLFSYVWSLWIHYEKQKNVSTEAQFELLKIKKNISLFKELLQLSRKVEVFQSDYTPIYGNRDSSATVTIVMNVYCQPCAKAHSDLMEILSLFPNKLNIHILFTGNPEDENDKRNENSLYLLQVYNQFGIDAFEKELSALLKTSNGEKAERSYTVEIMKEEIRETYYKGLEWIMKNQISGTPTIFINQSELPSIYQVPDLKYILNDL